MSMENDSSTVTANNEILQLYSDIFHLVEEEIYQRRSGGNYVTDDRRETMRGGGAIYGFVPGKFDAMRNSMAVPLDVAVRGTIARQRLFIQEMNNGKHASSH